MRNFCKVVHGLVCCSEQRNPVLFSHVLVDIIIIFACAVPINQFHRRLIGSCFWLRKVILKLVPVLYRLLIDITEISIGTVISIKHID